MYFYRAKRDFRSFNRNLSPPFAIFHSSTANNSLSTQVRTCAEENVLSFPKSSEEFRKFRMLSGTILLFPIPLLSAAFRSLKIKMSEIPRRTLTEDNKVKTLLKRFHSHIKTLTLSAAEGLDFYTDLKGGN